VSAAQWFVVLETAQMVVAVVGLTAALSEWRTILRYRHIGRTEAQRILARHALFIELLRCSVHLMILATAGLSLWLPAPPADQMPAWITELLVLRKAGFLWVAVIATLGSVSSRRTRLRVAKALET